MVQKKESICKLKTSPKFELFDHLKMIKHGYHSQRTDRNSHCPSDHEVLLFSPGKNEQDLTVIMHLVSTHHHEVPISASYNFASKYKIFTHPLTKKIVNFPLKVLYSEITMQFYYKIILFIDVIRKYWKVLNIYLYLGKILMFPSNGVVLFHW